MAGAGHVGDAAEQAAAAGSTRRCLRAVLGRRIADAAEAASCPPDYIAGPVLAAASMLIGNARWVSPWPGWKEPPVLWIGVVGDPSAGKSPGSDPTLDALRSIEIVLAADFEAAHREWATARESACCARDEWERAVKDACKAAAPAPILPPTAVEPQEPRCRRGSGWNLRVA